MQILKSAVMIFCTLLFCTAMAPRTTANEWNKRTIVTFREAVEIPGKVLPPGIYIFKLAPSNSDRHIVQVWNARENQLLATTMTVPDERLESPDHPVFDLEERSGKSPMALKCWFYQGDRDGEEFVYSENPNGR